MGAGVLWYVWCRAVEKLPPDGSPTLVICSMASTSRRADRRGEELMNAAEYLLAFFGVEESPEDFPVDIDTAFSQMHEAQQALDTLVSMHVKYLDIPRKAFPGIWAQLMKSFLSLHQNGSISGFHPFKVSSQELTDSQVQALQALAEKMPSLPSQPLADANGESVMGLLNEVRKALARDDSLPLDLRLYALRLVNEAQRNLEEHSAGAEFRLATALERLLGVISIAEERTEKKTVWENIRNTVMKPFMDAFLSSMAQQMVGSGADLVRQLTKG